MVEYHDSTKHHFNRFARSAGYLDWATQPDPFRKFDGADLIDLVGPLRHAQDAAGDGPAHWLTIGFDDVFPPATAPRIMPGLDAVSVILRFSLGLSAWKRAGGQRWALRVNPSSGNLHPTEAYVVLGGAVTGGPPGVFHYRPDLHAIERRCSAANDDWDLLAAGLPPGAFFVALTSIHWREAWKYGERAFRYCQHDTGHAIAALSVAAAMTGWRAQLVHPCPAPSLARLLGVAREGDVQGAEPEEPECLLVVSPSSAEGWTPRTFEEAAERFARGEWRGHANRLSPSRVDWPAIDAVAEATRVPGTAIDVEPARPETQEAAAVQAIRPPGARPSPASRLLLQRRSAVAMTGGGDVSLARFQFLLRRLMPGSGPPWSGLWWEPRIHLALFVHRVRGLDPGLYVLARSADGVEMLRRGMRADFAWVRPPAIPDDIPLYLLVPIDVRRIAGQLSCGQAIAADGYFSVAMLAEFDAALEKHGPWFYRHLFWEAGTVGQVLYLEAEAMGARGTGIGCYFDDAVHELLGVSGHGFQSLYHFTVGEPVEDDRLGVEAGYGWEAGG